MSRTLEGADLRLYKALRRLRDRHDRSKEKVDCLYEKLSLASRARGVNDALELVVDYLFEED